MKKSNEGFQAIYEVLCNLAKLEKDLFENPAHYQGIQLPVESKYRADTSISYYSSYDRYSFLFDKENNYRHLYHFLQTNTDFRDFQINDLRLYMGLFAYVDYDASEKLGLRYLYGPMDLPGDINRPKPHFFLKTYFQQGIEFIEEYPDHFSNSMESFYYSRLDTPWDKLDFVRILQAEKSFKFKRTQFEKDNDLIYAPSGEMDGCILMWILLMLDEKYKEELLERLAVPTSGFLSNIFLNDEKKVQLDFGMLRPGNINEENYKVPYENREYNFFGWLKVLGLVHDTDSEWDLTERGVRFLHWVDIYIQAVIEPDKCLYENYRGILERVNNDLKAADSDIIYNFWLEGADETDLGTTAELFKKYRSDGWKKENQQVVFYWVLKLMLRWKEPGAISKGSAIESFQKRCRFNLYSHFILRSGDRGGLKEDASRAWIVFPILTETVSNKILDNQKTQNVGFFLGTFNDSIRKDNKIDGFFEEGPGYNKNASELFFKLKVIVGKLADIENREIFYSGIFEDRLSKNLFHKLHHSQYTFLETLRIIAKRLPVEQQYIFNLANDSLGKYLDIARHLPGKLDSYLQNHRTELISFTEILYNVTDMIKIIFQESEAAQRIFKIKEGDIKLFNERLEKGNLIEIKDYSNNTLIKANKELTIIILKELLINALRNTPRYDPLVTITVGNEDANMYVFIKNEYSRGGNIAKSIVATFGQDIILELLEGLLWKHEIQPGDTSYCFKLYIPVIQKNV